MVLGKQWHPIYIYVPQAVVIKLSSSCNCTAWWRNQCRYGLERRLLHLFGLCNVMHGNSVSSSQHLNVKSKLLRFWHESSQWDSCQIYDKLPLRYLIMISVLILPSWNLLCILWVTLLLWFSNLSPKQNGWYFIDIIFLFENDKIVNNISLRYAPVYLIDNSSTLKQLPQPIITESVMRAGHQASVS